MGRADPNDRRIFGYSLGGLFSTYLLFNDPSLFQKYFIGSPALFWDDKAVFNFYAKDKFDALENPVQVYLSVGEKEAKGIKESWQQLRDFLEQKRHPNIRFKVEILTGEYHLTGIGLAHSRAFRALYEEH